MARVQLPYILAGTLGFHLALATIADAYRVFHPYVAPEPAPHLEMVDLIPEPEPVLQPPPPPVPLPPAPPEPAPVRTPDPTPPIARALPAPTPMPPDPTPPDPTPPDPTAPPGGEQVVHMEDIAPTDHGVAVRAGKAAGDRVGRGGHGGGTGSGDGSGSGGDVAPAPAPISIAKLKTPAKPRGDFSYFDAGKDYPPEARRQGIEGTIKVKLVVDAMGKVASAALVTHLGYGLDELALERAKALTFLPAIDTDDHPTRSLVIWTFNMTLPK